MLALCSEKAVSQELVCFQPPYTLLDVVCKRDSWTTLQIQSCLRKTCPPLRQKLSLLKMRNKER